VGLWYRLRGRTGLVFLSAVPGGEVGDLLQAVPDVGSGADVAPVDLVRAGVEVVGRAASLARSRSISAFAQMKASRAVSFRVLIVRAIVVYPSATRLPCDQLRSGAEGNQLDRSLILNINPETCRLISYDPSPRWSTRLRSER
jgi:hypothetical protein